MAVKEEVRRSKKKLRIQFLVVDDYDERDYLLVCKDIPRAREISKNIEAVKKVKKLKKVFFLKKVKRTS